MATQVAGNVNADHEISSQQRNNLQATNRIRHNTMEHVDGNFRHNNSSGEGVNGPPDGAVNNVLGSPGQPPGGGGSDLGTKAAAVAGMNANMNQDGGQQQSGMTTQQPGSNSNMDPFSSGGGGMQPNSNMPNQLTDNPGGKPGSNMGGTEGYNGGFYGNRGGNYGMVGQHGGHGQAGNVPPNSNMNMNMGPNQGSSMPTNSYNQYDGHMGPRPGYSPMAMGSRTGPNMPPNYGSSHQRPFGENRIANSAPTLSQLLQGQKGPSYSSNYSNQGDSLGKGNDSGGGMGMMGNPGGYPSQWGQRGGMPGSMSHGMGPGGYGPNIRSQMGMMLDGGMGQKRAHPGSSPYPQPNQYGGRQYAGNMPGYPMGSRGQSVPPNSMGAGNQYGQQMPPQYSQGQPQPGMGYNQQQHSSLPSNMQQQGINNNQQQQQGQNQVWGNHQPSMNQQNQQNMPPQNPQQPNQTPNQQQGPGFAGRVQQQSQPPTPSKSPMPNQAQTPQAQTPQQQHQQQQQQQQPNQAQQPGQQPPQASQKSSQQQQQQQPAQNQQQQSQSGQTTNDETNSNRPPSLPLPDLSGSLDDLSTGHEYTNQNVPNSSQANNSTAPSSQANNDTYSTSSASQSPHMHPSVTALRPSPSPVGSPASHLSRSSLSPASVQGGPVTPQPAMVPPSSQSDSSSQNQMSQSPVGSQPDNRGHNQGTNQSPSAMHGGPPPYGGGGSLDQHQQDGFNEGFDMFGGGGSRSYEAPPNQMAPYYGGPPSYGQNMQPGQYNPQGNMNRFGGGYPTSSSSGPPQGGFPQNQRSAGGMVDGFNNSQYGYSNSGSGPNTGPNAGPVGPPMNSRSPGLGTNAGPVGPPMNSRSPGLGPNAGPVGPPMNSRSPGPGVGFNQSDKTERPPSAGGPTPPPNQTTGPNSASAGPVGSPTGPNTPKGAAAAAAAAIMAAANTAANKPMYHRTLQQQPQQPGQPPQQRFPPPYNQQQQQQPPNWAQQQQQNAGYPTSGGPGGPQPPYSSVPNSMPNSMPGSGPPHNSMGPGGNMPPGGQMALGQMNSMSNAMGGPNSGGPPGMMGQMPPNSAPGSAASSTPSSMTDSSEAPISAMGAMASAVAASDTSSQSPSTTVANSVAGGVATTVTQSITSPLNTSTVTTNSNNAMKPEIKNEQQQQQMPPQQPGQMPPQQQGQMPPQQQGQMPPQQQGQMQPNQQGQQPLTQAQLQAQQVQLLKEESGYGPASPPIGLMGASPAPLASPGATSKSSQDDGDSRGSPSVANKVPASPVSRAHAGTTRRSSKNLTSQDVMQRQAELDEHPERRPFLERVFSLMEERNQPIKTMPQISTHTLDLFKLYHAVRERGGVLKVSKGKQWKQIAQYLAVGSSNSAAFTLKKNFIRYLLPFECVNELGNCDPQRIISEIESMTKKKGSSASSQVTMDQSPASAAGQQNMIPLINSHDGFPRPGPGGRQMYPGQPPMPNNMPGMHPRPGMGPNGPSMTNELTGGNSVTVRDPFADSDFNNAQQGQYPGGGGPQQNSMDGSFRPGMNSMNQFRNNSMGGNDAYGATGNRGPAQGNDPYNSGMRNSGMPPQGAGGPYNRAPNMGANDGFNNRTPMSSAESFPGNNRGGGTMGMNQGGATGQQYPYGSGSTPFDREGFDQQQRVNMAPSPSAQQPPNTSGMMTTYPNNSSGDQSMYPPSSRGFGGQGSGSRPGTPNDSHTRPPFPNNQQQTPQQGMFPGNDQMRPQFPQKRPQAEIYGPGPGKRPEYINQQSPMGMGSYGNQSGNFPPQQGHMGAGQHSYPPSYRDRGPGATGHGLGSSPFADLVSKPSSGQGPLMGLLSDWSADPNMPGPPNTSAPPPSGPWPGAPPPRWNDSRYPFTPTQGHSMRPGPGAPGSSPSPSWGTMHQRHPTPYGPGQSGGPRTLQQALMAAAHRGREHNKMSGKPSSQPMPVQMMPKKEIVFPPDSVEATQPKLSRYRRKTSKDIGPVEAWRLMMSLKSGLLAESTWALDVLNILLYDNSTIMYFDLAQLQGLLEILVDHFRSSLKQVFDTFDDLEVRTHDKAVVDLSWEEVGVDEEDLDEDTRKRRKDGPESEEDIIKQALSHLDVEKLKGADKEKSLGLDETMNGFYECEKPWDNFEGFLTNQKHWNDGRGDMTGHIMHVFEDNTVPEEPPAKTRKIVTQNEEVVPEIIVPQIIVPEINCKAEPKDSGETSTIVCKTEPTEGSSEVLMRIKVEPSENDDENGERTEIKSPSIENNDSKEDVNVEVKEERDEYDDNEDDIPLWQQCCSEELRLVKREERQDASKGVILCYQKTAKGEDHPPLEEEGTCRDNTVLVTCSDGHKELSRRCLCLSNIVRSLSFIPGNDTEMANHPGLLSLLGRLLLLQHRHGIRKRNPQTYNRDDKDDLDTDMSVTDEEKWWWDCLENMRENAMVTITNISGHLDLSLYPESISLPILDGLLHWSICLSASALDPFQSRRNHSMLSPKRLAIEALAKLSIQDNNVDMILATPPFQRLDRFFATLTQFLGDRKKPVMREFSIVLLSSLAQGDGIASCAIALQNSVISLLLCYMEDSEYAKTLEANSTASQLSQNPDIQPASPDMMRRAALTLACLARHAENKLLFLQHQSRLLNLNMSPVVHDIVKKHLSDVLFEVGKGS